jgi:integrase
MADLYQRPDSPYWWHAYDDPLTGNRKRRSTGQTEKRLARTEMQTFLRDQLNMRAAGIASRMTLGECLERHLKTLAVRKVAGIANLRCYRDRLLGRQAGHKGLNPEMPLERLTTAVVDDLRLARIGAGYAGSTINHEIKFLAAAWRTARERKVQVADPPPRFRMEEVNEKKRVLSPEQFQATLAELDPAKPLPARGGGTYVPPPGSKTYRERAEARDLFVVLCLTGCRWGEVAKMTWDQVEAEALRIFGWKTKRPRFVPLAAMTREVIARRRVEGLYVFPGRPGRDGKERHRAGPSRAIQRAMDRAGVNPPHVVAREGKATIHTLRHTFATWFLDQTGDLATAQDLMGHADPSTTRIYTRLLGNRAAGKGAQVMDRLTLASAEG